MSSRSAWVTVVKPHYKAIATPVISLLSSFVTRPGDREGAGEGPRGLCEPMIPGSQTEGDRQVGLVAKPLFLSC